MRTQPEQRSQILRIMWRKTISHILIFSAHKNVQQKKNETDLSGKNIRLNRRRKDVGKDAHLLAVILLLYLAIPGLCFLTTSAVKGKDDNAYSAFLESSSLITGSSVIPQKLPNWSYPCEGIVNHVSISAGSSYIVAGTSNGYLYLFNASNSSPLDAEYLGDNASLVAVSYDGGVVAACAGKTLRVYRRIGTTLQYLWSFANGTLCSLAVSGNGSFIAVGTRKEFSSDMSWVHVFRVSDGNTSAISRRMDSGTGYSDRVSVDVSGDGQFVVAGSSETGNVTLFRSSSADPVFPPCKTSGPVYSVSMSADGQYYVAGGGNMLYYFSKNNSTPIKPNWPSNASIRQVSISSDGSYSAVISGSSVYLLNGENQLEWMFDTNETPVSAYITEDGNSIVASTNSQFFLFSRTIDGNPQTSSHEPQWIYQATTVNAVAVTSNANYLISGIENEIVLFSSSFDCDLSPKSIDLLASSSGSPKEGELTIMAITIENRGSLGSAATSVRIFLNSIWIGTTWLSGIAQGKTATVNLGYYLCPAGNCSIGVVVDPENFVYESNETNNAFVKAEVVDAVSYSDTGANPIIAELMQTGKLNSVSLSGNGEYMVAGSSNNEVFMFYQNHSRPMWTFDADAPINNVSISEDGSYLAAIKSNTLYVFSKAANRTLWSYTNVTMHSLVFSGDGRYLIVGTRKDGWDASYVHFFCVANGNVTRSWKLHDYTGYSDRVSVDVSGDGQFVVAGSSETGNVTLFRSSSADPVFPPCKTSGPVYSVSMSADGQYYVAGGGNMLYYFRKDTPVYLHLLNLMSGVRSVSMSHNGTCIAATNGTYLHFVKREIDGLSEIWNYNFKGDTDEVSISSSGNYVLARSRNFAHIFSQITDGNTTTSTHDPIWSYNSTDPITSISLSQSERYSSFTSWRRAYFFDVLHKCDLRLTNVTLLPNSPNEGENVAVSFMVYNSGLYKSYYANVSAYEGTTRIGKAEIAPVEPNAYLTASFNCIFSRGSKTINAIVDQENLIYESDKTNNNLTKIFYVYPKSTNVTLYPPTLSSSSYDTIILSWSQNNDTDFKEYRICRSLYSGQYGERVLTLANQLTIACGVTGLNGSTTYYFVVAVTNVNNGSAYSNQRSATTQPTPVNLANPTNPKPNSLDLWWNKNMDENFTRYDLYRSNVWGQRGNLYTSIYNQSQVTTTVTGLASSTTYYFTVTTVNPKGLQSDSNQVSGTTAPSAVSLYSPPASNITATSVTISWTKYTGSDFLKYEIIASTVRGQLWPSVANITTISRTTYVVTGLNPSTTYFFVVKVYSNIGISSSSNEQSVTTAVGPAPYAVTLYHYFPLNSTLNSILLTWSRNTNTDFARYEVIQLNSSTTPSRKTIVTISNQTQTSFNVTGLQQSTTYNFIICTYNQAGKSADSNNVSAKTRSIHDLYVSRIETKQGNTVVQSASVKTLLAIRVVVENWGAVDETFDVVVLLDSTEIARKSDVTLVAGGTTELFFDWTTPDATYGTSHYLRGEATTISGELDVQNNSAQTGIYFYVPEPSFWTLEKVTIVVAVFAGGTLVLAGSRLYKRRKKAKKNKECRLIQEGDALLKKDTLGSLEKYAEAYLASTRNGSRNLTLKPLEQYVEIAKTLICKGAIGSMSNDYIKRTSKIHESLKKKLKNRDNLPSQLIYIDTLLQKALSNDQDYVVEAAAKDSWTQKMMREALGSRNEINIAEFASRTGYTMEGAQKMLSKCIELKVISGFITTDGQKFISKEEVESSIRKKLSELT